MQISFPHFRQRHAFEIIDTPVRLPEKNCWCVEIGEFQTVCSSWLVTIDLSGNNPFIFNPLVCSRSLERW